MCHIFLSVFNQKGYIQNFIIPLCPAIIEKNTLTVCKVMISGRITKFSKSYAAARQKRLFNQSRTPRIIPNGG